MEKINCPKCGKELIRLEPYIEATYDFWCDNCDVDMRIVDNHKEESSNRWYNFRKINVTNSKQGSAILSAMRCIILNYGFVTIADLHDLLGLDSDYDANNYGWTKLDIATCVYTNDGVVLKFDKPIIIN